MRKSCCVCHPDLILTNAHERIVGPSRFLQSASLTSYLMTYKLQATSLLTLRQKGLCNCQHLLTTSKIRESVEQNVLRRSTRPFSRHHKYKRKKAVWERDYIQCTFSAQDVQELARYFPWVLYRNCFRALPWL